MVTALPSDQHVLMQWDLKGTEIGGAISSDFTESWSEPGLQFLVSCGQGNQPFLII